MKASKSLSCGDLSFKCVNGGGPYIGFMVSKKYGNAAQRNLFKRRCRSAFRSVVVCGGSRLSIIVRPKSKRVSFESIYSSFFTVYEKFSN